MRPSIATLRRLPVPLQGLLVVDRQVELAVDVDMSESALRPSVATLRRLPVPLLRLLLVSQQAPVDEFVGAAEMVCA